MKTFIATLAIITVLSCNNTNNSDDNIIFKVEHGIVPASMSLRDSQPQVQTNIIAVKAALPNPATPIPISTISTINAPAGIAQQVVQFAETQIGVPYVYASCDPKVGFDCSGFIKYVFNHFNIQVPRSSHEFENMGKTVQLSEAKTGDIILFTGTDNFSNDIGHIGLVVSNNNGTLNFIHSTSGKQMGVTITTFNNYYQKRLVRVCRVFKQDA